MLIQHFKKDADFDAWIKLYDKRIAQENNPNRIEMMKDANPKYILRNYLANRCINRCHTATLIGFLASS
jgi:uncharacterized protein YdiU (UPF0061 family)